MFCNVFPNYAASLTLVGFQSPHTGLKWVQGVNRPAGREASSLCMEWEMRSQALSNYRRLHGCEPSPYANTFDLIRDYYTIPTLEELSARLSALDEKLAKYREKRRP